MRSQKKQEHLRRGVERRSEEKELFWRNEITKQKSSGMSMRQYCIARSLNENLFHAWRRTIAERDQEKFLNLIKQEDTAPLENPFVPLTVVGATEVENSLAAGVAEIKLPGGSTISLQAGSNMNVVVELLLALEKSKC